MKKWLRNIGIFMAALCMSFILCPNYAKATPKIVNTYQELQEALEKRDYDYSICVNADEDFGWPSQPTTVTWEGPENIDFEHDMIVPSHITINQKCRIGGSFYIKGVWNVYSSLATMTLEKGGILNVNKNSSVQSLTVKSGGILNNNHEISVQSLTVKSGGKVNNKSCISAADYNNGTIIVEKGAIINAGAENDISSGQFILSGGTLQSNGAVIPKVTISAFISHTQPAKIKGNVEIQRMFISGDLVAETLNIISGSKVGVTKYLDGYGQNNRIVVESGSTFRVLGSGQRVLPADIIIQNGGNFIAEADSTRIQDKHTITIKSGGTMTVIGCFETGDKSGIIMESGSKIKASNYIYLTTYDRYNNGYIKGKGTIYIPNVSWVSGDSKSVASTIKIVKDSSISTILKKGSKFTVDSYKYIVTSAGKTAYVYGVTSKNIKSAYVYPYVMYKGVQYQIKGIYKNAFKDCKKLNKLSICSASLTVVGTDALKNTAKKLTIYVQPNKFSAYKKLFTGKGNKTIVVKKL